VAERHPHAFVFLLSRPYTTPRLLRFCDDTLRVIAGSGSDPLTATRVFHSAGHFLDGGTQ
jgi:hypothetical protein